MSLQGSDIEEVQEAVEALEEAGFEVIEDIYIEQRHAGQVEFELVVSKDV